MLPRTSRSALLVLMLVAVLPLTAVSENLLLNAGFETNSGAGGPADYWANTEELGAEAWAASSGNWGMAFVTWRGDGTGLCYQDVAAIGNTPYTYKLKVLRDSGTLTGEYRMGVEWYEGATYLGVDSVLLDIPYSAWVEKTLVVTSPPSATIARVLITGSGINIVGKFDDGVVAAGHDRRIDLRWRLDPKMDGYNIYAAASPTGPFTKLNSSLHSVSVYSDFFGVNGRTNYYYVTAVKGSLESEPSAHVSAASYAMTDEQLLTSVQEATFRYFWDYGHPFSGLTREGYGLAQEHTPDTCAAGGTGFGLMAICVGAERGFVTRAEAAERVLRMLIFLDVSADRYHGAWSHWINGTTGETIPFFAEDNGGDLVETALLMEGILTCRQYFDSTNSVETEIRNRAGALWGGVDWYWYLRRSEAGYESNESLYWHWSPDYGWAVNLPIHGFNEGMIIYLLAIASPTHPVPASCYYNGWAVGGDDWYANGKFFYNYLDRVGYDYGGPLFFTHYSFMGFDPRNKNDRYADYFENNRNISLINRAYCADNPKGFAGYSSLGWGLTASFNPWGYGAQQPGDGDNGTLTPSAALSAMPYTPAESIATLRHFYETYGPDIWGPFGFVDAFHVGTNWFAPGYIAIDQGPIVSMIENYRSQLCWNKFMANPEIQTALNAIGWVSGKRNADTATNTVSGLNYEYYEGVWSALPDFDSLVPVSTGSVANFDLSPRRSNDHFAFRFTGYIEVPTNGGYTFYTESDDGSQLFIGNALVVDNDQEHGLRQRSGFIALNAGRHALTVTYFEHAGAETLNVSYVSQEIPKTRVPGAVLSRVSAAPAPAPVTLLQDGFETSFDLWTDGGATDWDRTTAQKYAGSYSAHCGSSDNDLISDNLNTAGRSTIRIEFWYRDQGIDDSDNVYLQLYNGTSYVNRTELGITSPESTWHKADITLQNSGTDAQYFRSGFRIKIEGSAIDSGENLWIDDVKITVE
ncbi:MAG: hypothetical protein BWK77_04375 [Verrucomicrobia bacterium A1]|nr:MAG: hypothetical protein BWK77_04375 [Verrucomicrobia bacterium A1]